MYHDIQNIAINCQYFIAKVLMYEFEIAFQNSAFKKKLGTPQFTLRLLSSYTYIFTLQILTLVSI